MSRRRVSDFEQWLRIERTRDRLAAASAAAPPDDLRPRVVLDSGFYCPLPGRPLPPVEAFLLSPGENPEVEAQSQAADLGRTPAHTTKP